MTSNGHSRQGTLYNVQGHLLKLPLLQISVTTSSLHLRSVFPRNSQSKAQEQKPREWLSSPRKQGTLPPVSSQPAAHHVPIQLSSVPAPTLAITHGEAATQLREKAQAAGTAWGATKEKELSSSHSEPKKKKKEKRNYKAIKPLRGWVQVSYIQNNHLPHLEYKYLSEEDVI